MTMPHLMNCHHAEESWSWCLDCVKQQHNELESAMADNAALRSALKSARLGAKLRGITTREFAAMCAISPTQLSQWTADVPGREPDLM